MINYLSKLNNPFTVLSVQEVSKDLNIGINQAYDLFKQEDFPSINIGKRKLITLASYLVWKMNIHRTLTTDENNAIIMGNKTKTYAGKRIVPIPDFIYPYIVEQMQVANAQDNNEEKLLFKPLNSKYTRRTNVNSELQRILKRKFNITDISTHSLRHTFGTRCIESGMAPVVVQRLMGHKDIGVTLNTYTTVFDKFKQAEIDKVNKYYLDENLIEDKNTKCSSWDIKMLDNNIGR